MICSALLIFGGCMQFKKLTSVTVIAFSLIVLLGCAAPITRTDTPIVKHERKFTKNYEIGKQISSYIGNPMIQVKDYKVVKRYTAVMEASQSFILTGGLVRISINKGEPLIIAGEIEKDGKKLTVLDVPNTNKQITVDETGKPYKDVINDTRNQRIIMAYDFKANPPDVIFSRKSLESIEAFGGDQNFEILYGGKTDRSMNLTYREYTSDNIARPAFIQNLTYEADAKIIRFKSYKIEVISVTNEQIDFRVIEE